MADRVNGISAVRYNSSRVTRVSAYTPEEYAEKMLEVQLAQQKEKDRQAELSKIFGMEKFSFIGALEKAAARTETEEADYIIDIGNHRDDDDGVIVDIASSKA